MSNNTYLEIICAEALRFSSLPRESVSELQNVRAAAAELAAGLALLPERSSRFYAYRLRSLEAGLQTLLHQGYDSAPGTVSDDFRWLKENTRLLYNALQETAELGRIFKKVPQVRTRSGATVPRVLAVAEGYLAAVDCRFSGQTLAAYIDSFQETTVLNVEEVWALAPCLTLALLEAVTARTWQLLKDPGKACGVAECIRSLHYIGQASWKETLEPRIVLDRVLRQDPAGAYAAMDFESRECYWKAVAEIAANSDLNEMDVAGAALSLAQEASCSSKKNDADPKLVERRAHVGYYLVGEGAAALQRKAGFRPSFRQRLTSFLRRHPDACYLSGIHVVTLMLMAAALVAITGRSAAPGPIVLALAVLLLPCSQSAVEAINLLITSLLPVRLLPKLDFSEGIPDDCVTMVAVPVLLLNESQVRRLVEDLEVRYLGNRDRNLHFALLTDLPDSKKAPPKESPLVALCAELIEKLNDRYAAQGRGTFFLLHRHSVYNPRQRVWMGWERKRGKLIDFYRLLRGKDDAFAIKAGDLALLTRVRYVITLDADTELPRGSAQRMIGTLAHPLNQAIVDPRRSVVVAGYGILQPRVGISVQSAARSRLAKIYSGQTGLDIYTRAVSDVYQDLYGEGIFIGKGICDVDVLLQVLDHRFPDNALLSHDLIEGAYARAALASDIELIDDYPSHYAAYNHRLHRWIRGDWQVAEWLLPRVPDATGNRTRNPISLVSRWKILDNLRRSLVEPATFLMVILGWLALPGSPLLWTATAILLMFSSFWLQLLSGLARAAWSRNLAMARNSVTAWLAGNLAGVLRLTFLAHQALLSLDAVVRALVRRLLTHRGLLDWETAAQAELGHVRLNVLNLYLDCTSAMAIAVGVLLWAKRPAAFLAAAPILVLWGFSKLIATWLNQPPHPARCEISAQDRSLLRTTALRTWRYFAEWSNEEHHWLIPDNLQEEPHRVAERTSPTNLALLLNARQAACELGYLTVPEFAELTAHTLATIEALPKHRGHLFNWYDTRTLEPLRPRFVSSADSGNLVAALWALQQGCLERLRQPLLQASLLEGFLDHVVDRQTPSARALANTLKRHADPVDWLQHMRHLAEAIPSDPDPAAGSLKDNDDSRWFFQQARGRQENVARTALLYCPWLLPEFSGLRENPALGLKMGPSQRPLEKLPAFIDAASERVEVAITTAPAEQQPVYRGLQALLREARLNTARLIQDLRRISTRAGQLAHEMDFQFLFNRWRKLLSVGFDVERQQLHEACYDLLASEARLAVFVAIAKEEIPQEAWFLMGRPHRMDGDRPVLLSWTGTMFEYLMPSLWMRTYPNTLLERSRAEAVRSQQAYAARLRIPWGISESAYAVRDEAGNYQYRAFGLPPLALHKAETDAAVVSPYSTLLALPVATSASLGNLRRISREGWLGSYGFYEAADYTTTSHSSRHRTYELVRCWMAHHQGMSLLAVTNLIYDSIVQTWFHRHPRVQATELLLQEKPVAEVRLGRAQQGTAAA
jgi:cyclic beta-1,2-glucan synthetase